MTGDTGLHEQMIGEDSGQGAVSALAIVAEELMETIRNAQLALEDCVDGRGGTAALVRTGELLHQAGGALRMTETYGAALLVEEMEKCCEHIARIRPEVGREDGLEALTRSMVQLPIYIERLLGGGRDIALVLLPMLNDLRAARGEPLLSEGTLLLLNLAPSRSEDKLARREGTGEDPVVVVRRLRPKFQLALLGWIKGGDNERHLETLARVAAALEHSATRDDMYRLWMVVGGVLESLQNGGLETSVALKRLLGQSDRQLKFVIDEGLEAYDTHPVDDLMNNLLYYVARSSTAGERIGRIRAAFNLEELLPGDEQVEHAREALSAPSVKLMETVAAAIKEDLARVKDVLDIFVRTGMNKPADLVPQLELSRVRVPYYQQTTDFTCGPASLIMAFKALLESGLGNSFQAVTTVDHPHSMYQPVGGMDQIAKAWVELGSAAGQIQLTDAAATQQRDHRGNIVIRHALGAVRTGIDMAVQAGLVAEIAQVDL